MEEVIIKEIQKYFTVKDGVIYWKPRQIEETSRMAMDCIKRWNKLYADKQVALSKGNRIQCKRRIYKVDDIYSVLSN